MKLTNEFSLCIFQEYPNPAKNYVAFSKKRRSSLRYINYFPIFNPSIFSFSSSNASELMNTITPLFEGVANNLVLSIADIEVLLCCIVAEF